MMMVEVSFCAITGTRIPNDIKIVKNVFMYQ